MFAILLGFTCQLKFQPIAIDLNTSYRAFSPVVADFNSDGRSDVAILIEERVKVLFGDSNGSFISQITLPEKRSYSSIAVGDFNNDAHIDLVFSGYFAGTLGTWFGNGDGTFETPIIGRAETDSSDSDIFVAHFNNDSYLDLAVSDHMYGRIYIYFGNGDGTFTIEILHLIEIAYAKILMNVAHFNNDSYSDIVVSDHHSNYIVIFLGYGNGRFQRQKRMFTGPNFSPESVTVNDLNGDGRLDIVFSYNYRNVVSIMFGYGDGSFTSKKNFPLQERNATQPSVVISDFNEDGLLDIITDGANPYCVDVLIGRGNGSFEAQRLLFTEHLLQFRTGLVVGDFNGDGHQDILSSTTIGVHLNIRLNTCNCCT